MNRQWFAHDIQKLCKWDDDIRFWCISDFGSGFCFAEPILQVLSNTTWKYPQIKRRDESGYRRLFWRLNPWFIRRWFRFKIGENFHNIFQTVLTPFQVFALLDNHFHVSSGSRWGLLRWIRFFLFLSSILLVRLVRSCVPSRALSKLHVNYDFIFDRR